MITLSGTIGKTVRATATVLATTTRVVTPAVKSLAKGTAKVYRAEELGFNEAVVKTKEHIDTEYAKTKSVIDKAYKEFNDYKALDINSMLALASAKAPTKA